MFNRRFTFWILLLIPLVWLGTFFLAPSFLMGVFSFRPNVVGDLRQLFVPTLAQYSKVLAEQSFLRLLGISIGMALIVAAVSVLLSYPIAYFLAFRSGKRARFYLVLLLVPFWTSFLLRVMALKLMLGSEGVIDSFLKYIGLTNVTLNFLVYNRNAVIVTLIYVWIPFSALPILAALQRIDLNLFEAAADLGAKPFNQFREITLPLSMPGVFAAFFMVFIPTVGEYVTPLLVGGSSGSMYGNIIQDFFTKAANWSLGSALSMIMLLVTAILLVLATRVVKFQDLLQ